MAPVKIGVLLLGSAVQVLDASTVDLLGMLEPSYLAACQLPPSIVSQGTEIEWHYVSEAGPSSPFPLTAGAKYVVTDDLNTCPPLDILVVPGPPPTYQPSAAEAEYVRRQLPRVSALLCVCTGYVVPLQLGLLDGKAATAPRGLLKMLRAQAPHVKWVESRWAKDEEGKIWTSGGVTNGLDMVAAFMRETMGTPVVEMVLALADTGERGVEYQGPGMEMDFGAGK